MSTIVVSSTAQLVNAVSVATAGEIIQLAPGAYAGVAIQNAIFSGKTPVTIESQDNAHQATITGLDLSNSRGLNFKNLEFSTVGNPDSYYAYRVTQCSDVHFFNLNVHGNPAINAWDNPTAFLIRQSYDVSVNNSSFQYLMNGIGELNNKNVTFNNNSFSDISSDGIDNGGSSNVVISGNKFTNFRPFGAEHPDAVQFWTYGTTETASNILVAGNTMTRGNGGVIQGVFVQGSATVGFNNVTISGNTITGEMYNGIAAFYVNGLSVSNNRVSEFSDMQSWIRVENSNAVALYSNATPSFVLNADSNLVMSNNILGGSAKQAASSSVNGQRSRLAAVGAHTAETSIVAHAAGAAVAQHAAETSITTPVQRLAQTMAAFGAKTGGLNLDTAPIHSWGAGANLFYAR